MYAEREKDGIRSGVSGGPNDTIAFEFYYCCQISSFTGSRSTSRL